MIKRHWLILIITIVAAVLIFANLANQYLWQDEAETAVLASNPLKYGFPRAFDYEGVPKKKVEIVQAGVVLGPVYDRATARKAGVSSTGHAVPPSQLMLGPAAGNLFLAPGTTRAEQLIASTRRGLYITRFWYTRQVHPRDCTITGMTRDGVFMTENGELAYPVKNLRFTQSYLQALADVDAIGSQTRLLVVEYSGMATHIPALKIGKFNFTGVTV